MGSVKPTRIVKARPGTVATYAGAAVGPISLGLLFMLDDYSRMRGLFTLGIALPLTPVLLWYWARLVRYGVVSVEGRGVYITELYSRPGQLVAMAAEASPEQISLRLDDVGRLMLQIEGRGTRTLQWYSLRPDQAEIDAFNHLLQTKLVEQG